MKKNNPFSELFYRSLKKTLLIMRIAFILMILGILQARASDVYSQKTKLSLNFSETEIVKILDKIENESEFFFLYNEKLLDTERKVSIDEKDQYISTILDNLFTGTDVKYTIIDRKIILAPDYLTEVSQPQQIKVTGTVKDANTGEALVGVNIVIDGTTTGVISDMNGKYSITVPNPDAVLKVTYIGYVTQKISLNGRSVIDISLTSDIQALEDVVVVGYGSVKKRDLTGSVSSVKAVDILKMPTQRVDQALQGRTTGVFVLNTDGAPGGNTMVRIRGLNSISGGNEPLIVIDGLQGGNLNSLNPNDISSMEILKDASATAIYGSRGANGVILITTKVGKLGKPVIDFGYNTTFQQLGRKIPVMNAADFATLFNEYKMTQTGQGNIPTPQFTQAEIDGFRTNGGTDWQDVVFKTGVLKNSNLAISGATEKLRYMISTNYLDHKGILINSYYTRASLRANVSADITDWVDFGLNYNFTKEVWRSPSFTQETDWVSEVINLATRYAPTEPVYNADGSYAKHRPGYGAGGAAPNPVAEAYEPIIKKPTYRNNTNLFLNFKLMKGLTLKVSGGGIFTNAFVRDYYNLKTFMGNYTRGRGRSNQGTTEQFQVNGILTYDNTFGAHHLTVMGVAEQITSEYEFFEMIGQNFLVDQLGFDSMGGATTKTLTSAHSKRALVSYMGRINYGLKDKYLATFSYRADASSVFGSDHRWGFFPSGSLAWKISEEEFLKNVSAITDLKLRVSYGVTGNQAIPPYRTLAALATGNSYKYPWDGGSVANNGYGLSRLPNTDLKWESTSQSDIGLDVSLFKGRLTSTVDVYKKVTKDLMMSRNLPTYNGVSSVLANVGSIQNTGLEIQIGGDPVAGNVRWNTSFNFTMNRNKVLNLGPDKRIGFYPSFGGYGISSDYMFLEVGQPWGLINGWKFLGIWGTDQEAEARSYGQLPGDPRYADINGSDEEGNIVPGPDGQVDAFDRVTIGHAYPKFTWGWTNSVTYKGLELSLLFIGSQGNDLFNTARIRAEVFSADGNGLSPKMMNYWTPTNQNTTQPGMIDGKYREDQNLSSKVLLGADYGMTSRFVEDASFIRLKTITLGYSFEQQLLKTIGFEKARAYLSGTNLITITGYTGFDPEVAAFAKNGDTNIGVDLATYPQSRSYTIGIDFTF